MVGKISNLSLAIWQTTAELSAFGARSAAKKVRHFQSHSADSFNVSKPKTEIDSWTDSKEPSQKPIMGRLPPKD